jgi:cytochrome c peroxidase
MKADKRTGAVLACVLCLMIACRRDEPVPPLDGDATSTPTPAMLQLPAGVEAEVGMPVMPADNPLTVEGIALGRKLYYEKALSDDLSMSCATCHEQQHGFADPNAFSAGTDGSLGTRNAMSLVNLAWSGPLFWDGRSADLEAQAHDPVTNPIEMRNTWPVVEQRLNASAEYRQRFQVAFGTAVIDSNLVTKAIAQFERSIVSFRSPFDRFYFGGDTSAISEEALHGFNLFRGQGKCGGCHVPGLFTDQAFRNNGLDLVHTDPGLGGITGQTGDMGKFKVPTLRNIAVTGPYMHDGRFATLAEVIAHYNGGVHMASPNVDGLMDFWGMNPTPFSLDEVNDLTAFLLSLTDEQLLADPALAAP